MKLKTVNVAGKTQAAIVHREKTISIEIINELLGHNWNSDVFTIVKSGELAKLTKWYNDIGKELLEELPGVEGVQVEEPLYRSPAKILGVGMNYLEKAIELSGKAPQSEPVIFLKPSSSLIGGSDAIQLPVQSENVSGEAELAIVIGKTCKHVSEAEAGSFIAGFTASLDMTAKDIHARDPRYLQRSKSFDSFFSFGSVLHTTDEYPDWKDITVETVKNGEVIHQNQVRNMIYSLPYIVSFFSGLMTLEAGDIIMTGTPGSVQIQEGDLIGCRITGLEPLENQVKKESLELMK